MADTIIREAMKANSIAQYTFLNVMFNNNEQFNIMNKMEEKDIIDIAVKQLNRQTALFRYCRKRIY